jgi:hypothetical protein
MTGNSQTPRIRTKLLAMLIATIAIVAFPLALASTSQTITAAARDAAVGNATIIWGNPFLVPTIAYGTGWERLAIRGVVLPTPGVSGYYTFQSMRLLGNVHAQWVNGNQRYVLDASFSVIEDFNEYQHFYPIKVIPAANALEATGVESSGTLTINGKSSPFDALAALATGVPGALGFQGTYPAVYIVFYISSDLQIMLGWSQASQTIRGIFHPACSSLVHMVRLSGENIWW